MISSETAKVKKKPWIFAVFISHKDIKVRDMVGVISIYKKITYDMGVMIQIIK